MISKVAAILVLCVGFSFAVGSDYISQSFCDDLEFVSRDEWGSKYPIGGGPLITPVDYVFIHHTDMAECNDSYSCDAMVRYIQEYHVKHNGWDDIGYNFLVGGDGRVYVGRDWDHIGAQTYEWNNQSIGIAMMGTYEDELPSDLMINVTQTLVQCGIDLNRVKGDTYGLYGHRDGSCTTCPGDALYAELHTWPHWYNHGHIHQNCANDTSTTASPTN